MGGTEFIIRDICERLVAKHGVDVTVFTTNAYTNENFRTRRLPTVPIRSGEVQNGVRVTRFPVVTRYAKPLRVLQKLFYTFRLPGHDWLRTWYQGPISPEMLRATSNATADVICAASFPLNHMLYPFRRSPPRPPVILYSAVHTNDAWGYRRRNLMKAVGESYATVAFTEHERDWMARNGADASRIRIIPLGVDPTGLVARPGSFRTQHGIPADDYVVAYVGQQGGHKGIEVLIAVLPALLEKTPNARLVVGGARTPYSATLRGLEARLPKAVADRLLILDDLDPQAKADLLADCDVFASPSGYESFGITTLEAWSQKKPVILGDTPVQREIVGNTETGILVPYRDKPKLLQALLRLAASPPLRHSMGIFGHARLLEKYTLDRTVDDFHSLFAEAVNAGRVASSD